MSQWSSLLFTFGFLCFVFGFIPKLFRLRRTLNQTPEDKAARWEKRYWKNPFNISTGFESSELRDYRGLISGNYGVDYEPKDIPEFQAPHHDEIKEEVSDLVKLFVASGILIITSLLI